MQITKELIESLLLEEESATLDFKQDQYPFANASDEDKSELLKDILAFTNAFRRSDAFILIGVRDIKGGRGEVVGISEQIDDAHLQQFVNSKTQRPVSFTYKAAEHDGLPIAIIHIPLQFRPV
jgi:predicted HTH transcriptional regulator